MEVVQQMMAAGAMIGLLGLVLWWMRRRGLAGALPMRRSGGRRLEYVERLALGPQHALHLVRIGDRALLVSSSPAGCAVLEGLAWREIDSPREAAR